MKESGEDYLGVFGGRKEENVKIETMRFFMSVRFLASKGH